jgi:tripartite-type tricarboxylate transporter receptor subunit TctC
MKLPGRALLHLAVVTALFAVTSGIATAQTYPARPVRIIVGFAPGGATDILARLLGQRLSERLGQQFIVENRPGAGTNIATEAVVRAPADGYTLLLVSPPAAINATLYEKLDFNFIRDIAPVASIARAAWVLEVNPAVPVKSVPELIAYGKANPGRINMATVGVGSGPHLAGELFNMMSGVDMVFVSYRGAGAALADLMGGQVQANFDAIPGSIEFIRAGKLRALAVTTATRSEVLPETPTLGEFLPRYEASFWAGFGAPKNTPAKIIEMLNREVNAALADPAMKARLADLGASALAGSSTDFGKLIAEQTEKWAKVIRAGNIKPE